MKKAPSCAVALVMFTYCGRRSGGRLVKIWWGSVCDAFLLNSTHCGFMSFRAKYGLHLHMIALEIYMVFFRNRTVIASKFGRMLWEQMLYADFLCLLILNLLYMVLESYLLVMKVGDLYIQSHAHDWEIDELILLIMVPSPQILEVGDSWRWKFLHGLLLWLELILILLQRHRPEMSIR